MSDAIRAALITSSVQLTTGFLTLLVALAALNSWRRNTLGIRQIQLAEECLQAVWALDKDIKAARLLLAPMSVTEIKSNARIKKIYAKTHSEAWQAMGLCAKKVQELTRLFMLAEFYLGDFPKTKLPRTARFFNKIPYTLPEEYKEIVGQLCACLMNMSPEWIESTEVTQSYIEDFEQRANMFFGFIYEYEEDDYSVRLRISRILFERYMRSVLRRQNLVQRLSGKLWNLVEDGFSRRFKPVTKNKRPFRLSIDNSGMKTEEN